MSRPITIVGGGLAGLALGIELRRRKVAAEIFEASTFPRHRVCGEFLSGAGTGLLTALGVGSHPEIRQSRQAFTARFVSKNRDYVRKLPEPALAVSRYELDQVLAAEFVRQGGVLHQRSRWADDPTREGVVRATGRQCTPVHQGLRYFGLKAHARNVSPGADLEMHFFDGGYVGLARLDNDRINVCGLFHTQAPVADLQRRWRDWLSGPKDSPLRARLRDAVFDEASFTTVAGVAPLQKKKSERECCVGDAMTMVPPFTGNGMSVALESGILAAEPLARFSRGESSWEQCLRQVAGDQGRRFDRRLRWSRWLQQLSTRPVLQGWALGIAGIPAIWRRMFAATR